MTKAISRPPLVCEDCGANFARRGTRGAFPRFCASCLAARSRQSARNWSARNPDQVAARAARRREREDSDEVRAQRAAAARMRRAANPEQTARARIRRRCMRYGITVEEYARLLRGQCGKCAICRATEPSGRGDWHIDHDHITGQVRGLLCSHCNTAIGMLKDDPEVIAAALRYVRQHRQTVLPV